MIMEVFSDLNDTMTQVYTGILWYYIYNIYAQVFYDITGWNNSSLKLKNYRKNYFKRLKLSVRCQDLVEIWLQEQNTASLCGEYLFLRQAATWTEPAEAKQVPSHHFTGIILQRNHVCLPSSREANDSVDIWKHHLEDLSMLKVWVLAQSWKQNSFDNVLVPEASSLTLWVLPFLCAQQPGKVKPMTAGVIWHRGGSLQRLWPINPNLVITLPLIRKCALISRAEIHTQGVSHEPNYQHLLPGLSKAGTAAGDVIVSLSFWAEIAHKNMRK